MPLQMPVNRAPSSLKVSCRPNPPSAVRSSAACAGLTVTTASQNFSPPLSMLSRPYHSRRSTVYSSHGNARSSMTPGGKWPWYPALCTDITTGVMEDLALPWELYTVERLEWYGRLNMLKGGLKFCDAVVTVSPAHAAELRTAEGGFGLHDTFNELGARFTGICNGIDQRDWDPATDRQIAANYSSADLSGKAVCKEAAQRAFGLPCRPDVPLLGMSSRLVGQKGFDILLQSARLRSADVQLVVLGQGELRYHDAVSALAATHP